MLDTYETVVRMWEQFCKLHSDIYDMTCAEYNALLASDLEAIEEILEKKNLLLEQVSRLDYQRAQLISDIHQNLGSASEPITRVSDLLRLMAKYEEKNGSRILERYNLLLIDMIEKIKEQNKNNQIFLNKAIHSLDDLKKAFEGKKTYQTYGANGKTVRNVTQK